MSRRFIISISFFVLSGAILSVYELRLRHRNSPAFADIRDYQVMYEKWVHNKTYANQSPLQQFFTFTVSYPGVQEPFRSFKVAVGLKKEFSGTAVFYSCDMSEIRLLEVDTGEFINKVEYKIHAKSGQVLTLEAEYYQRHRGYVFGTSAICGEVYPDNKPTTIRPHVKKMTKDLFDPYGKEYSVEELLNSLMITTSYKSPSEPFAVARAKKLLMIYPREKVLPILAELIDWVPGSEEKDACVELLKIIIGRFGGKEAATSLSKYLNKDYGIATRIIALKLLVVCGNDAIVAAPQIKTLLESEKDDGVVTLAVQLAKILGIERPLKYLSPEEVSAANTANYKKEIVETCEDAAKLDLAESYEPESYYDDEGKRIPAPGNVLRTISRLDELIEQMPNYPEMARVYLLAGMSRQKYQNRYYAVESTSSRRESLPPSEIRKIVDTQFIYFGPDSSYYYNGWHFRRLLKLFPDSLLVPDAEYEIASKMFIGGESEDETTGLYSTVDPLLEFLRKYPGSSPVLKAVNRMNFEFDRFAKYFIRTGNNLKVDKPGYSAAGFVTRVSKYETLAKKLPLSVRGIALDEVCTLWELVGQKNRAKATAEYILNNVPDYQKMNSVRSKFDRLSGHSRQPK